MRKLILFFGIIILVACNTTQKIVESETETSRPSSFWYYDADFALADSCELQLAGLYFRIVGEDTFGDTYKLFRFYDDGLVIAYVVYNTPDKVVELEKTKEGNIHGYYKVENDSLFFTTRVYHDKSPTFYRGKIFTDSLILHSHNYVSKTKTTHSYYFYKK